MTKKVIVANTADTLETIAKIMQKNNIGAVIIVDDKAGKKAGGIITERDIVHKLLARGKDPFKVRAEQVMSKPLRVVRVETPLEEAARAMKENKIKRLPVVNHNNELIGIISEGDIMRIFPAVVDIIEERAALK